MITHFDHQCLDHFAEWNSVMKSRLTEKGFHNYVCHKCDQEEKGKQLGRLIYVLYKHTHFLSTYVSFSFFLSVALTVFTYKIMHRSEDCM